MAELFTVIAFTENSPGVLQRITDLFTRRKINIESLTVSETERKGISRFTIVVAAPREILETIVKQINRVIEVERVLLSENKDLIFKEIAFFKVLTPDPTKRSIIEELAHRYGASMAYATESYLVFQKTGSEDEVNSLFLLLEPFGIGEFVRSGRIAILKTTDSATPSEELEQGSKGEM